MQRHAERLEAEFFGKTELTEPEEVFVKVFSEVAANELLAAIVEGTDSICTSVIA